MQVKVERRTTETVMTVVLDDSPIAADYRKKIKTPIPFLNHMIEHTIWRSEKNITVDIKMDEFYLTHALCEDLGITLGKAVLEYIAKNTAEGVLGYGDAVGMIDEAKAHTAISFESRAYLSFCPNTEIPATVEEMASEDLVTFFEGFVQGAQATLHIDVKKGVNGHHIWEAVFRSFGHALYNALSKRASRADMTSGVAGKIEFTIE